MAIPEKNNYPYIFYTIRCLHMIVINYTTINYYGFVSEHFLKKSRNFGDLNIWWFWERAPAPHDPFQSCHHKIQWIALKNGDYIFRFYLKYLGGRIVNNWFKTLGKTHIKKVFFLPLRFYPPYTNGLLFHATSFMCVFPKQYVCSMKYRENF